jgi:glycosyltransferase involved in cell wall biosynthesis
MTSARRVRRRREDLVRKVDAVLSHPDRMQEIRDAARATAIRDFDLESRILPQWVEFLGTLIGGGYPQAPPPSAGLAVQSQLR